MPGSLGSDAPHHLISVLITVYNKEDLIGNCIYSLLDQSTDRFDIIVIDDGSEDNSLAVCEHLLQDRDPVIVRQPHSGVAEARNNALARLRSKYFIFLDADDTLEREAVEKLTYLARTTAPDLAIYGFCYEMPDGTRSYKCEPGAFYDGAEEIRNGLLPLWRSGLMYSVCNKMFKTSLVREARLLFEKREIGEDIAFCRRYFMLCASIQMMRTCFYHYTCHPTGSLSTSFRADLYPLRLQEHREMTEYFREAGRLSAEAWEYLSTRYIGRIIGCIENECIWGRRNSLHRRYARVRSITLDEETQKCAKASRFKDRKMSIMRLFVIMRAVPLVFLSGICMAICHVRFPRLFVRLKVSRRR